MQQRDRVCAEPVGGPECPKWQTHTSSTRAGSRPISPAQVKHILVWELVFSLKIMFWYQTFLILKVLSWGLERWLSGSGHLLLLQRGSGFSSHQFAATTWWFMTSVIPVPKNPALSSDLHRYQACMWRRYRYRQNTHKHKNKSKKDFLESPFLPFNCLTLGKVNMQFTADATLSDWLSALARTFHFF